MRNVNDPRQNGLFDPFASVLSPMAYRRILKGWQGTFRHVILKLMPVDVVGKIREANKTNNETRGELVCTNNKGEEKTYPISLLQEIVWVCGVTGVVSERPLQYSDESGKHDPEIVPEPRPNFPKCGSGEKPKCMRWKKHFSGYIHGNFPYPSCVEPIVILLRDSNMLITQPVLWGEPLHVQYVLGGNRPIEFG